MKKYVCTACEEDDPCILTFNWGEAPSRCPYQGRVSATPNWEEDLSE